jgi:hypothetical protein
MATKLYDAIVSADGKSDYLLPSAAFGAGAKSIFVRSGTYMETGDLVIPNGGTMIGESAGGVTVNFGGTSHSVKCDSNPATIQTGGTIAVTNGSAAVVGTGTSFTNLSPGDFISVSDIFLPITSITDDTHLNIAFPYMGVSNSGFSYVALTMLTGISILNLTITGSTTTGLYIRGCNQLSLESITIVGCSSNFYMQYCNAGSVRRVISFASVGDGFSISNSSIISFENLVAANCSGHGVHLTNNNSSLVFNIMQCSTNGGSGCYVDNTTTYANFSKSGFNYNVGYGFYSSSTSTELITDSCIMNNNGSDGANMNGDSLVFKGNITDNEGNNGIVVNGNNCLASNNISINNLNGVQISGTNNIFDANLCRNSTNVNAYITSTGVNNSVTYNNLVLAGNGNYDDRGLATDLTGNML